MIHTQLYPVELPKSLNGTGPFYFVRKYWCRMNGVGHGGGGMVAPDRLTKSEAVLYSEVGIGDYSVDLRNPPYTVELRVQRHMGVAFRVIMVHACVDEFWTK